VPHNVYSWYSVVNYLHGAVSTLKIGKEIPSSYGIWRFISVFTGAHHWTLSWAIRIQPIPLHSISVTSILILYLHLRLGLSSVHFQPFLIFPTRASCPSHVPPPPLFNHPYNIMLCVKFVGSSGLRSVYSQHPIFEYPPLVCETKFHTNATEQVKL